MRHAVERGGELGLDMGMHNCAGWSASGGPWITPELSMQKLVWSQTFVTSPAAVPPLEQPNVDPKFNFYRDIVVLAVPNTKNVQATDVIDLTSHMTPDGALSWTVPAGTWTIYRIGHTTTGKTPHPMPDGFEALECDKLSAHAATIHLQHVLDAVHQNLSQPQDKAFAHILFDSYEAGPQNWTEDFRQQFINLRGYDPIPWLPVITGKKIGGDALSKRFQWDMNRTISELFVQNNFGVFAKMLKANGIRMCFEPYKGPFDTISATAECDTPMGEFWTHIHKGVLRAVPAAAQALGRTIVGAESFTGNPIVSQWSETPAFLKPAADAAICSGVNQFYLHEWTLQPFGDDIKPGLTAGWWGTHFGRNQTWFVQGQAWFDYLARCAAVLQHGEVVSDFCTLEFPAENGDALSDQLFAGCTVQDGKVVAPSGRRYALLVLPPDSTEMLPETAAKLKSLVADGAIILGPKPIASPSLGDYPNCDSQVAAIGNEVWGDTAGTGVHEHNFGKGKVYWNQPVADVLAAQGILPDFQAPTVQPEQIGTIHRQDGNSDIFFLANFDDQEIDFTPSFRVAGKVPEIWYPADGHEEIAGAWKQNAGRTEVPLSLQPHQSIFVVFQQPSAQTDYVVSWTTDTKNSTARLIASEDNKLHLQSTTPGVYQLQYASGKSQAATVPPVPSPIDISDKWHVRFSKKMGTPDSITLDHLQSWTDSSDQSVKYFSGTAAYSRDFELPADFTKPNQRVILDLGTVDDLATVNLNGHDLGVLWNAPFRIDVTEALKGGDNHLEVAVTNTWHNRLIGDEQQPPDFQWGQTQIYNRKSPDGRPLTAFPDWVVSGTTRPSPDRYTFTSWNYFDAKSRLNPSGLLGPVNLRVEADVAVP
jgi:hypothetical protein